MLSALRTSPFHHKLSLHRDGLVRVTDAVSGSGPLIGRTGVLGKCSNVQALKQLDRDRTLRVREGEPDLLSAFADVRAQMVLRGTGVVVWEDNEDVTNPERLPLEAFTKDREFTRHELTEVLERAGQRLASELLYARGAGR